MTEKKVYKCSKMYTNCFKCNPEGDENWNHNEIQPHTCQSGCSQKDQVNFWEEAEEKTTLSHHR